MAHIEVKNGLDIHPVGHAERVLRIALELEQPDEFLAVRHLKVVEGSKGSGFLTTKNWWL